MITLPVRFRRGHEPSKPRRDRDRCRLHSPLPIALAIAPGDVIREGVMVRDGSHGRCLRVDGLDVARRASRSGRRRRRAFRQADSGLFADDGGPFGRIEPADEADVAPRPPGLVPGDPDAVRVAEFRLAVVLRELLGGEGVLSIGRAAVRIAIVLVESVHQQRAVDPQRLVLVRAEEHQSAAKAPSRRTIGMLEHDLTPNGHHLARRVRPVIAQRKPLLWLPPVHLRTANQRRQADNRRKHS